MTFIKTQDTAVASYLRQSGYEELPHQGNFYVFLNNGKATFTEDFRKKVVLTNKLNL